MAIVLGQSAAQRQEKEEKTFICLRRAAHSKVANRSLLRKKQLMSESAQALANEIKRRLRRALLSVKRDGTPLRRALEEEGFDDAREVAEFLSKYPSDLLGRLLVSVSGK